MTAPKHIPRRTAILELLLGWIEARDDDGGVRWLRDTLGELRRGAPEWRFFTSFSAVPRRLGKSDLRLSDGDLKNALTERAGWDPSRWSIDQAARTALTLALPSDDADEYVATLDKVFSTADVGESVALYQSLPLLPHPEHFTSRASEGLRSNMTSVFNAVALDNPYPAEYLSEAAWNQMVLKAVFVGSPLHRIFGLDTRSNADLARMLVDYARERRAASRSVEPELWRPVGPFIDDAMIHDLDVALQGSRDEESQAAALALHASGSEPALRLLESKPDLKQQIESGSLSWAIIGRNRIVSES